jgi:hypothetical protein
MDIIHEKILNYINFGNNKDYLKDLFINDPEYFAIFINMEIIGNEIGLDITLDDHEILLNNLIDFIIKNI